MFATSGVGLLAGSCRTCGVPKSGEGLVWCLDKVYHGYVVPDSRTASDKTWKDTTRKKRRGSSQHVRTSILDLIPTLGQLRLAIVNQARRLLLQGSKPRRRIPGWDKSSGMMLGNYRATSTEKLMQNSLRQAPLYGPLRASHRRELLVGFRFFSIVLVPVHGLQHPLKRVWIIFG